jgi:hypothetical protein
LELVIGFRRRSLQTEDGAYRANRIACAGPKVTIDEQHLAKFVESSLENLDVVSLVALS